MIDLNEHAQKAQEIAITCALIAAANDARAMEGSK